MSKRNYMQKLLDDMRGLPPNRFFNFRVKSDYEKILEHLKVFIDSGEPFELNEDYTSVRRISDEYIHPVFHKMAELPHGVTIVKVCVGQVEEFDIPVGKTTKHIRHVHEKEFFKIMHGGKTIKVE